MTVFTWIAGQRYQLIDVGPGIVKGREACRIVVVVPESAPETNAESEA